MGGTASLWLNLRLCHVCFAWSSCSGSFRGGSPDCAGNAGRLSLGGLWDAPRYPGHHRDVSLDLTKGPHGHAPARVGEIAAPLQARACHSSSADGVDRAAWHSSRSLSQHHRWRTTEQSSWSIQCTARREVGTCKVIWAWSCGLLF